MGFLDGLGLGFLGYGPYYPQNPFQNQQAMAGNFAMPLYIERCPHHNCPMCKEENERIIKSHEETQKKIALKKQDYERRCIEYMKRFRKRQG